MFKRFVLLCAISLGILSTHTYSFAGGGTSASFPSSIISQSSNTQVYVLPGQTVSANLVVQSNSIAAATDIVILIAPTSGTFNDTINLNGIVSLGNARISMTIHPGETVSLPITFTASSILGNHAYDVTTSDPNNALNFNKTYYTFGVNSTTSTSTGTGTGGHGKKNR